MTKEQQAWMEYGMARGRWYAHRTSRVMRCASHAQTNRYLIFHMRYAPGGQTATLWRELLDARKRAHAWNPKGGRRCKNCAHLDAPTATAPCERCNEYHNNWEPRTDGKEAHA